jgi:hypothetical protein
VERSTLDANIEERNQQKYRQDSAGRKTHTVEERGSHILNAINTGDF